MKLYIKVILYLMVFLFSAFIISGIIICVLGAELNLVGEISLLSLAIIFSLFFSGYVIGNIEKYILKRNKKNQNSDEKKKE